ncbi:MAG: hypothetical protein ACR2P9_07280 [Gammaproteobacteria bacterium]
MQNIIILLLLSLPVSLYAAETTLPDTGISGVYEVMVGTDDAEAQLAYFAEFGFTVKQKAELSAKQAQKIYGVKSALTSIRLQNGEIDSHGLLRILQWQQPLGDGVGYAPPETIGQRMAVMRTLDIFRIHDVFLDLRHKAGEPWLSTPPVFDDLYGLDEGEISIQKRRVGVRENAVYGQDFNHVFFQRYGYTIPGYGSINKNAPLQTSEFTHHDFIVNGDLAVITDHYATVLGLKPENDPVIDGDWQKGPQQVFQMPLGTSHWYRGFVSPNNICGKLKFFSALDPGTARDRSTAQRIGAKGITLHSLYTTKLKYVHKLARQHGLRPSSITQNEFGETSFLFTGPDGVSWQILQAPQPKNRPRTVFNLESSNN